MTTIALGYKSLKHNIHTFQLPNINWKAFCFSITVLLALLLVLYVYQINALTGGTYLIKNYNKQLAALAGENKQLESQFAQTDFLATAMSQAQALNFQKITEVTYLQMPATSVAKAK